MTAPAPPCPRCHATAGIAWTGNGDGSDWWQCTGCGREWETPAAAARLLGEITAALEAGDSAAATALLADLFEADPDEAARAARLLAAALAEAAGPDDGADTPAR